MTPTRRHTFAALAASAILAIGLIATGGTAGPKFYPDDPITKDVESQDASGVAERDASQLYDAIENSVLGAGERANIRALNVNTIDEVPVWWWYTMRAGGLLFPNA
jgi:hypothetical protein